MERQPYHEHLEHDTPVKTYEQVALEALVARLYAETDRRVFAILDHILQVGSIGSDVL